MQISKDVFNFLNQLKINNERDWFKANKSAFEFSQIEVKKFFFALEQRMQSFDRIEKHSIFRVHRDVRFSKDKSPFKPALSGYFRRLSASRRGSYFLNIEPGASFVGGGFYGPNANDLLRIRQEFEMDDSEIRAVLNAPSFLKYFGTLQGDAVKTAPKGFDKNHEAIDLIRMKQFYVMRNFSDQEVMSEMFFEEVLETFQAILPFFDLMSAILTTDLNGESTLSGLD